MRAFEVHHCSIFGQNASNYAIWYFHHQQPWQILIKICANVNILGKTSQKKTPFFCPLPPPHTHTRTFGQLFHLKMKIRAGGCSSNLGIAQATGCFFWEVFPQSIWVSAQRSAKFLASDQTNRWCKSQRARCEWLMRNLFRCKLAAKSVPPKNCHHHRQQQQHSPRPIARQCWMLIAQVKSNLLNFFRFSFFCSTAFWICNCRITSALGCSRNTSTCFSF